jgi:hypothetical protein
MLLMKRHNWSSQHGRYESFSGMQGKNPDATWGSFHPTTGLEHHLLSGEVELSIVPEETDTSSFPDAQQSADLRVAGDDTYL